MSTYFSAENSKFGNEKYKKNCARLGISRDFGLINSYTIESSCWGFDVIGKDENDEEEWQVEQFKEEHFLVFGQQLVFGIARHFNV